MLSPDTFSQLQPSAYRTMTQALVAFAFSHQKPRYAHRQACSCMQCQPVVSWLQLFAECLL